VVTFAGCVLVVSSRGRKRVLAPFALAILLTSVLSPPVAWLERWDRTYPSRSRVVTLVFSILGLAGWGLARQMDYLADDVPRYRVNILAKIGDVRGAGKGGQSRSYRTRSTTSRTTSEDPTCPEERSRGRSSSPRNRSWVLRFHVAQSNRRSARHGGPRARDGHLHAARRRDVRTDYASLGRIPPDEASFSQRAVASPT
jgi:hypothetical protein